MEPKTKKCPKCNGTMERGKLMTDFFIKWVKGKPRTKFALLKGKNIWTYACKKCGYIESNLAAKV